MRPRRLLLSAFALALIAHTTSTPARADWCTSGSNGAYIDMNLDVPGDYFGDCDILVSGPSTRVYVRATSIPFQRIHLVIPDVPGVTVVNESWGVSFTGNHATGVELDMGSCVGPFDIFNPTIIGYMDVAWNNPSNCTAWTVTEAQVQDCGGVWRPVYLTQNWLTSTGECGACPWQLCYGPMPPYNPQPANGATAVSLNTVINWQYTFDPYWPVSYIRISTKPDCSSGGTYLLQYATEFAPDFLQPGTTYYWQASYGQSDGGCQDTGGVTTGPIYSFTTEGILPTRQATWGHVKSLYRD